MNTNVLAVDTKVVIVTVPQSVTVPPMIINNILLTISNSSYYYNDGSYKGTLSFSSFSGMTSSLAVQYPDKRIYTYYFNVIYSGTVMAYSLPPTKDVSVSVPYSITVPNTVLSNIILSISNSSYHYDNESYEGKLCYFGMNEITKTFVAQYPSYAIYTYSFTVTYTGTVTKIIE